MSRTVQVPVREILDVIVCADVYGHRNDVLFSTLRDWLGTLTDEDIEAAIVHYAYEDDAREILQNFKSKYMDDRSGS